MDISKALGNPQLLVQIEEAREFRLLVESIPNLAWIARHDGYIYWYNQRWYEYTGTTAADMQGWGWQSVHDPRTLPEVVTRWQASIETGEPFEMTFPLRSANGDFRPFLTRVVPLRDTNGKVLRWFGTNTDVMTELQSADALRRSEQRFRTATQAIDGVLWTNNPSGQMHGEQPGWSGFTGQTSEQCQGYGWTDAVHPDDTQPTLEAWQEAVRECRLFVFEHRVRRRDGVYRLCSVHALPVQNTDGAVREWVGVHTDITEDRRTQQALRDTIGVLREQRELLEVAQFTNNVGFWRYRPSKGDLYLSSGSRRLLNLPLEGEVTFDEATAAVFPDDIPKVQHAMNEALRTGNYHLEFRTAAVPPQESCWFLGTARTLFTPEGEPYLVGMNLDITRQKRGADVLIRTEKLAIAGRLAASIAHEINNPLEAIGNLLYLLLGTPLSEEQQEHCAAMSKELHRVTEITKHTLGFHRQTPKAKITRIDRLIESVLTLFEGRLRGAGIQTKCVLSDKHEVLGFEGELRQVLANLVGNAIDAMGGNSARRILHLRSKEGTSAQSGRSGVTITIADTGTGMPVSTLAHIFEAFYTTKGEIGTGLGLWVSSEIIEKHQGELRVRSSQAPGQHGTIFRLFLPTSSASDRGA